MPMTFGDPAAILTAVLDERDRREQNSGTKGGVMQAKSPTEAEVLDCFWSPSNWGRWGEEDQLGTLNFLTPEKTMQAVALVQDGVESLGLRKRR